MTASFISSRKKYESFTLKLHCHYHQLLRRWGYGQGNLEIYKEIYQKSSYANDIPSETYPPPSFTHPETSRIYLTTPPSPSS